MLEEHVEDGPNVIHYGTTPWRDLLWRSLQVWSG
jgi:hypothetical protein